MSIRVVSLVRAAGSVEIALVDEPMPVPGEGEVVVRIQAAPINPSDLGTLLGRADLRSARASGTSERPVVIADVPPATLAALTARHDKPLPVGNEGAGVVVAAGSSPPARALLGKTVGVFGVGTYAEHGRFAVEQCLVLPDGISAEQGASSFVNPMTVLAMLETLRVEGHQAIVHTAAASSLGQMLIKACAKDGVPLVNVVRRAEQVALLRQLGAEHVCDSSAASFDDDLTDAIARANATLAFDALGGGTLASRILTAMERAALRDASRYSPYGSTTPKQLYFYGALERGPTELTRAYGMAWSVGGWLLSSALRKLGPDTTRRLRARVAAELGSTFATQYTQRISLRELLDLETMARYAKQATGEKYLLVP